MIAAKIQALKNFQASKDAHIIEAVLNNEERVIAMNVGRVLHEGKNTQGLKIRHAFKPYRGYSPAYEKEKKRRGLYQGHIDLHLSGAWLESLDVVAQKTQFRIKANRFAGGFDLAKHLRQIYPDTEGLSVKEIDTVSRQIVLPWMQKELREVL